MLAVTDSFELRGRISSQFAIGAVIETPSPDAAAKLLNEVNRLRRSTESDGSGTNRNSSEDVENTLRGQHGQSDAVSEHWPGDDESSDRKMISAYLERAVSALLSEANTEVRGQRLQIGLRGRPSAQVATCASIAMSVSPLIQSGYSVVKSLQSADGVQRLSAALTAYIAQHDRFPTYANFSRQRKPLLSWRVHLLPYLGHQNLYEAFNLDEPWDSVHNRQLIPRMPAVYQNPRRPHDHMTHLVLPVGKGTICEKPGGTRGVGVGEVRDGLSNTLMLVDAEDSVIWTEPRDLPYNSRRPWRGLGQKTRPGFLAVSADGSLRYIPSTLGTAEIKSLFSRAEDALTR